ncbi:MAG TPA: type II toxin-antitoxin system VapB family antitoxin [Candidatus Limnocylindria bacterium]|jgi:Arc/MetJ family transcription regulator
MDWKEIYVAKTTLEVDDAKVEAAKQVLGTRTLRDTVDRALDSVLAADTRRRTIERLRRMEGLDLDKPEVMDAAWR